MTFQRVVVTIAIVILILSLIVLGIVIYNSRNEDQYPPELGNCPDYYIMKQKGEGGDMDGVTTESCYNQHNLGIKSQECEWFDPNEKTNKERRAYAKKCRVTWDGITNF
jgi:hypothetical protein